MWSISRDSIHVFLVVDVILVIDCLDVVSAYTARIAKLYGWFDPMLDTRTLWSETLPLIVGDLTIDIISVRPIYQSNHSASHSRLATRFNNRINEIPIRCHYSIERLQYVTLVLHGEQNIYNQTIRSTTIINQPFHRSTEFRPSQTGN